MTTTIQPDLLMAFRARVARMGVVRDADYAAPVAVVRPESVPIRGNVHIPAGRVAKRKDVDRRFAKLKF